MSSSPERRTGWRTGQRDARVRGGLLAALTATAVLTGLATLMPAPALAQATASAQPRSFPGVGRAATAAEIAAWDIDVRPDFKGLPAGSGSVARGMDVWESKCASCHGVFGESNEVFAPLVGGTTKADIARGRVARLTDASYPGRTTMMKLSSVATLWDYIRRAMPWNAPKTLSVEEVYAVTAYLLNLAEVVPEDFTLSDRNIAEVQKRLPNRLGMSTDHGLWPGKGMGNGGRPDVRATACTSNCATESTVASFLPDHARNAHGNLAEQNRMVGAQHGADTTRPAPAPGVAAARQAAAPVPGPGAAPASPAATPTKAGASDEAAAALALFTRHGCSACHGVDRKVLGPALTEVSRKYAARTDKVEYLAGKILGGAAGAWGPVPMPAQNIPRADAQALARWIAAGAGK